MEKYATTIRRHLLDYSLIQYILVKRLENVKRRVKTIKKLQRKLSVEQQERKSINFKEINSSEELVSA